MIVGEAYVRVSPNPGDADRFSNNLSRALGARMRSIGRTAGLAVAGGLLAATAGLGTVLATGLGEIKDAQAVQAQTAAGIRSTGAAANVSEKQIADLASRVQGYAGVEDDVVQAGANLLLTFTKVRNEVGKGNDIFTRATEAGADLAARGFGSIEGNAKMLGKALNDPIKGIAALSRAGVTFTDKQKATIASLVASGRVLEAQKIILGEVETQVGGSAKAFGETLPGRIARGKRAFEDFAEGAITTLLPVLEAVLSGGTRLMKFLGPVVARVFGGLGSAFASVGEGVTEGVIGPVNSVGDLLRNIAATVTNVVLTLVQGADAVAGEAQDGFTRFAAGVRQAFLTIMPRVITIVQRGIAVVRAWLPAILALGGAVGGVLVVAFRVFAAVLPQVLSGVEAVGRFLSRHQTLVVSVAAAIGTIVAALAAWRAITAAVAAVQGVLNAVLAANPIGLVVLAVAGLVTALVVAYRRSEEFRAFVSQAFDMVGGAAERFGAVIAPIMNAVGTSIQGLVQIVSGVISVIVGLFTGDFGKVRDGIESVMGGVYDYLRGVPALILGALGDLAGTLLGKGKDLVGGLLSGAVEKFIDLTAWVGDIPGMIVGAIGDLAGALVRAGWDIIAGLIKGVWEKAGDLRNAVLGVIQKAIPGGGSIENAVEEYNREAAKRGQPPIQRRATGGFVGAGRDYLVGENGMELLRMGSQSGRIVPNGELSAAGGGLGIEQMRMLAAFLAAEFRAAPIMLDGERVSAAVDNRLGGLTNTRGRIR